MIRERFCPHTQNSSIIFYFFLIKSLAKFSDIYIFGKITVAVHYNSRKYISCLQMYVKLYLITNYIIGFPINICFFFSFAFQINRFFKASFFNTVIIQNVAFNLTICSTLFILFLKNMKNFFLAITISTLLNLLN